LIGTSRSFAPACAEALVNDLLRFKVDTGRGQSERVEGQYVEPVQLQVVCRSLWADLPPNVTEITRDDLRAHADVDLVLTRFYHEAVAAAAGRSRRAEQRIRDWVGRALITPGGTRGAAYAGPTETAGLPNSLVAVLEEKRLIRAEWRANARWFELTHDRLIEPIRASNERYWASRRRRGLAVVLALAAIAGAIAAGLFLTATRGQTGSFDLVPFVRLPVRASAAPEYLSSAAFSPDGKFIVTAGSDGEARVWYWSTKRPVGKKLMQPGPVTSAVFSNMNETFVLTASADEARVWRWGDAKVMARLVADEALSGAAFSFDDSLVVTAGADGAVVWDWPDERVIAELPQSAAAESAAFCPELTRGVPFRRSVNSCIPGFSVVTAGADGNARIWDRSYTEPIVLPGRDRLSSAAFSPDGRHVVTSDEVGAVRVWNWSGKPPAVEAELMQSGPVTSAVFSNPLGTFVLTAGADGAARIWDWESEKSPVALGDPTVGTQPAALSSAAFSPVGALVVTAGRDGIARIYGADQVG
jgi:WD40 repeat protein